MTDHHPAYDDEGNYLPLPERLRRISGHAAWAGATQDIARLSPGALLQEAADQIERLWEALEPFAGLIVYPGAPDDAMVIVANVAGGIIDTGHNRVTVGDLRRARIAFEQRHVSHR
jgi:hypothetical protein